jgi:signal transduction histidine kinase
LLLGHQTFLSDAVHSTSVDTLRFSLHPWNPTRLALIVGLLFFEAANLWACTLLVIAARALAGQGLGRGLPRVGMLLLWLTPVALSIASRLLVGWPAPTLAVTVAAVGVVFAALQARRALAWYRHATQASRLLALLITVLLPGLLLYPAILYHAEVAKRRLIETDFARQPAVHPQELLTELQASERQIDAIPRLADLVSAAPPAAGGATPTDSAFSIWRQTALAEARPTSAIELYGPTGALVSRFALNLPEYTALAQHYVASKCTWDDFGEAAPFGSEERRMLHAERAVCERAADGSERHLGTIVVHVMLDYRALPFLTSQGPYQQMLRATPTLPDEGTRGGDVELVIYGWGLLPIYTSGPGAWPIDEPLFARIYDGARQPFWTDLRKGGVLYHVYFSNDRVGIYALGYPALTLVDHLERLAEIATLVGMVYVCLLFGGAAFDRLARDRARTGAVLLREIRASFYRKLFLAFVLASAIPVITLALVAREYFATKLRGDAEAEAARTAAVAQRVIEEFAALQQRGVGPVAPLTDDLMVLISQLIDQDVNIFVGPRLVATSERDLFASGLLPQRTPHEIYRTIRLQRLTSYVGEDAIGPVRYVIAAGPVRAGGRDAILTVPLTLRQREIERDIDDLNRGIYLAALVFILLGAAIGLSMAERIADPVRRLTLATRRVARGDFDARILVRSSDELQRLVDAFNTMASELKAQAAQLERTHRLEAWAEMARQVAHEIKNPLTPIQLSAEHLRRVHADRGEPLSPVLESCIESILRQVGLLRQIASEFSAFASAPAPRPAAVTASELLDEVISPYRAGLADRIRLEIKVADGLPPLHVDRMLVARALVNVVENALHAMPGPGVLTIEARPEASGVAVTLADTGIGMDPEALARVFEPYFSTRTSGTGLGLTIAKRNIESTGGTIVVASARGRGTTVTVWLPTQPPAG